MRKRSGSKASSTLLFTAAVAFAVTVLALSGQRAALANNTGILVPNGQGYYSGWNESGGGSEVGAIDDGACGTGDGFWITGQYNTQQYSSYTLNFSSFPFNAPLLGIDVTVCYSDGDGTDLLQQVTPFIRKGTTDILGTGIDPKGSTAIASVTQHFDLGNWSQYYGLEIGLKDVGFIGRVKVWSLWAVVTYGPPPTFSLTTTTIADVPPPYAAGQTFTWQSDVTVSSLSAGPLNFEQTWDIPLLGYSTHTLAGKLGANQSIACWEQSSALRCEVPSEPGTYRYSVRVQVKSAAACSSVSQIKVTLSSANGQRDIVAQADAVVSLNGGCTTPTPTSSPTATASPTPPGATATTTVSPPTATGTSALPTSTPTSATGAGTSTPTPGDATSTGTPTPTPTIPPLSARPFRLREMQIARDGAN